MTEIRQGDPFPAPDENVTLSSQGMTEIQIALATAHRSRVHKKRLHDSLITLRRLGELAGMCWTDAQHEALESAFAAFNSLGDHDEPRSI